MSHYIDLNSDLGESFGNYTLGMDSEVLNHVTSANVACGWHAGDPLIMEATVKMCKEKGVAVGAHPGYPDLMGFGRRRMAVSPDEARAYMIYQLGALQGFCNQYDVELQHMKLHGAFYNMACVTPELADAVLDGLQAVNPNVRAMVLSGSYIAKEAERRGIPVIPRGFCRPRVYRRRHLGTPYGRGGFHKRSARGLGTGAHDGARRQGCNEYG